MRQFVLNVLIFHSGVIIFETIFGLPGIQLDPMFNALHDSSNEINVVNARHEQGVAYMAFGY